MTGRLQIKNNRYYMIINCKTIEGRYIQKWIRTGLPVLNNRRKAEQMLREKLIEYQGFEHATDDPAFEKFIVQWLEIKRVEIQQTTYETYRTNTLSHLLPYFTGINKTIRNIAPGDIQNYFMLKLKDGLHPNTVWKHKNMLSNIFRYAKMQGLIVQNPMERIIAPKKIETPVRFFTNEELEIILRESNGTSIETPVYIAVYCGFRRGEVLGLKWRSVNLKEGSITMQHTVTKAGTTVVARDGGKTKSSVRTIPIPLPLLQYLSVLKAKCPSMEEDYLCLMENGLLMKPDYLTKTFKDFLFSRSLPPYTFHTLRHSAATFLLSKGHQLKEIQGWLGHKRLESTNRYAHLQSEAFSDMAESFDGLVPGCSNESVA